MYLVLFSIVLYRTIVTVYPARGKTVQKNREVSGVKPAALLHIFGWTQEFMIWTRTFRSIFSEAVNQVKKTFKINLAIFISNPELWGSFFQQGPQFACAIINV